jgi:hypothetical protein
MSNLPDPKGFTKHKTSYVAAMPKESIKSYDLQEIHDNFMKGRETVSEEILVKQGNELINGLFYLSTPNPKAAKHLFGYSYKDNSVTIHLKDKEGVVQTVAIRQSGDVKWKTYGSKKFIPYRIEDDFIFLYSGMAETAIIEMLGLSYIGIQADGMVRHLPEELKELTADKTIIVLQDNDSSFREIVPKIKEFFSRSEVLVIDFERVLNRELKHGYDFRDFCNEIKDAKKVMEFLEIEIICLQDVSHVR